MFKKYIIHFLFFILICFGEVLYSNHSLNVFATETKKASEQKKKEEKKPEKVEKKKQVQKVNKKPQEQDRSVLFYAATILIGISTFIIANNLFLDESKFQASEKLEDTEEGSEKKKDDGGAILKYSRPIFKRYVSPIVSGMKGKKKIRLKYKRKLANAGLTDVLTPDDFFAFKLFLILAFPLLYLGIKQFGEFHNWPLVAAPFMGIVGYFYPDLWISGRIDQRQKDLIMAMPFNVDLLALSVEAGLDFMNAMSKVVEKAPPSALTEEFETVIKETKIGSSRAEALRGLSWRTNVIEIASFSATLIAADSVGASIGPILKTLSDEMRVKKSAEIEKKGAQAATKILFPMMFLIVPAVMIIIMAPLALEWITKGQ